MLSEVITDVDEVLSTILKTIFTLGLAVIFLTLLGFFLFFGGLIVLFIVGPNFLNPRAPKTAPPIVKKQKEEPKFNKYGKQIGGKKTKVKMSWFRQAMHEGDMAALEYKLKKIKSEK